MNHENRVVEVVRLQCVYKWVKDEFLAQKNFKVDFLHKIAFSIRRNKVALK